MRVMVLGGGITGLAAAYDLSRRGDVEAIVVEARDRLGGKVRTDTVDGCLIEGGPDSFVAYRPAARQLATDVGLAGDLITPTEPRLVHLRRGGRMVPFPDGMGMALPTRLRPFLTTPLFSPAQKLRAGLDLVLPRRLDGADVTLGEFLRARLGSGIVERLADPLFGGIYGTSVDELSLDATLPQLRDQEKTHRSLILAGLAQGRAGRAAAATRTPLFLSLRGGMGSLVAAVADRLTGVDVRLGTEATWLRREGSRTRVGLAENDSELVDRVIITTPAPVAARLLDAEVPAAAAELRQIPHATSAVVTLRMPVASFRTPPRGHGFLEAGPDRAVFSGCTYTSEKWLGRAPAGTALVRAFVPHRSAWLTARSDQEITETVAAEVTAVIGGTVDGTHLRRWTSAMPVYAVGHRRRVDRVTDAMRARPEWLLAGASYRGVGLPDCIAAGRQAAVSALAR